MASSNTVSFLALSCVGSFATAPAFATTDPVTPATDPEQRGPDVVVNGQRAERIDPKAVAPLINTPRSIVVLPAQVIEQTGSSTLQDALRTVPGLTFGAAEGGNPIGDRPFIRGFDSQGSIFVDGVRDIGAQSREVFATEQVQIVRGSDSTLGGRGSAGGTINIISRLPRDEDFGRVSASYGEGDYKRVSGDLNLRVADGVAFRVAGVWHDQDFAGRDAIYARRWGVAPSVTIGLNSPTRLTAGYYHLESHELPDSGIPYLYTIGNAPGTGTIYSPPAIGRVTTAGGTTGFVDRDTFYGLRNRDFRDQTVNQATVRAEHDFGKLTLRSTARFTHSEQSYIYTQPDDQQGNVYGTAAASPTTGVAGMRGDRISGGFVWRRANTRFGYTDSLIDQTDLYGIFRTGGIEHSVALGTEFAWEKARRGAYVLATGSTISPRCNTATVARYYCTSLFTPHPNDTSVNYASDTSTAATPIVRGATNTETQNDGTTQAAYAFDSITLVPSVILNVGLRFDRFTSTIRPPVATGAAQIRLERTDALVNGQVGLIIKPTAQTTLYASYATAATPPNSLLGEGQEANALPTTNTAANLLLLDTLEVEKSKSYEVGAKANLFGSRLSLGIAAFQTDTDNARVTGEDNSVAFIGERRIRGVELNVNGTVLPGWTVFGGYTHLDPRIVNGGFTALTAAAVGTQPAQVVLVPSVNTGKQATQTARDSFTATTNVMLFRRFQIGGSALYTSRVFGGYADNRTATQTAAGAVTVTPATKLLYRTIPGYWRFDARASVALTPHVELSVNAQNITDEVYFTQAYTAHYASIATGRTVFGTVAVQF